ARKYLAKNTLTPEDVVDTVPMVRYYMAGELTAKHKAEFQKFIDFSTAVGTLPEKVDITKYLQAHSNYRGELQPSSLPGLTRQSIYFVRSFWRKRWMRGS